MPIITLMVALHTVLGFANPISNRSLNSAVDNVADLPSLERRSALALPATVNAATSHDVDEGDLHKAMKCLDLNACRDKEDRFSGQIRCVVNDRAVVYVCQYAFNNFCAIREFEVFWRHLQKSTGSKTGFSFVKVWEKTVGFDTWQGEEGDYGFGTRKMCDNVRTVDSSFNFDLRVNDTDIVDLGGGAKRRHEDGWQLKMPY